jgi:hypothetical protein
MESLKNFGVVETQTLIEEFKWNDKLFVSYLITFEEYEGYFKIVREVRHEQALIGAKMIFNYSEEEDRITKYRIIGFQEKQTKVRQLLEKRKRK